MSIFREDLPDKLILCAFTMEIIYNEQSLHFAIENYIRFFMYFLYLDKTFSAVSMFSQEGPPKAILHSSLSAD